MNDLRLGFLTCLFGLGLAATAACGSSSADDATPDSGAGSADEDGGPPVDVENPLTDPQTGPPAGNPDGQCEIPAEAGLEDVSTPTTVVGDGTAASCTAHSFVAAVAAGGVITFDCGPDPVTITLSEPAKVFNDASEAVVIDGAGLVTLSGGGATRILYMNTCDEAQHWTTDHCNDQEFPRLTVQNITFVDGNASAAGGDQLGGGGAIWSRGGRFKAVNTRFFNNVCIKTGQDVGGGAVRVFDQFGGKPVYVVNSTFGGEENLGNSGSNGGALSSIGVSWTIINSLFSYNSAVGNGGNPADPGTPGGGSGGAIYNDGLTMTLSLCGSLLEKNEVVSFGSAIFFVSNDHTGTLKIQDSMIRDNVGGSWYALPGISMHDDTTTELDAASILK